MINKITKCRVCGNTHLHLVLDLGEQMLTGVFPREKHAKVTTGPLRLVKCVGGDDVCGLLQLEHSYSLDEMYGDNYGYRSGLNASMVAHLRSKVAHNMSMVDLKADDLVVDIGSNDSTTLQAYPKDLTLVGIDPTGVKFHSYYPAHVQLIPDFFSSKLLLERFPAKKAKVITSFSMFYDLENPLGFMQEIHDVLADDGIWVFEQSYMPTMLKMNSFDTACHEHLEYYALKQILWMTDRIGFHILDVEFNDVNGGSFSVTVAKNKPEGTPASAKVNAAIEAERDLGLNTLTPFVEFANRVSKMKDDLQRFVNDAVAEGKSVAALGASTKGNVLLQYCNLNAALITRVGEVNVEKFGTYTPGTWIPIVPEDELLAQDPDYLIVLPWHFRKHFESSSKYKGRNLVFPLPIIDIVTP